MPRPNVFEHAPMLPTGRIVEDTGKRLGHVRHVGYAPGNDRLYRATVLTLHKPEVSERFGADTLVAVTASDLTDPRRLPRPELWVGRTMQSQGYLHSTELVDKWSPLSDAPRDWPWQAWLIAYALDRPSDVDAAWIAMQLGPDDPAFSLLPERAQALSRGVEREPDHDPEPDQAATG